MTQDIKIRAIPKPDPRVCDFVLENNIIEQGAARFDATNKSTSPLALEIFNSGAIKTITIIGNTITVIQENEQPWQVLGKEIGPAIRRAFASGQPLLPDAARQKSPDENSLKQKVLDLIVSRINPAVASHGGYIELIDILGKDAVVRMGGGCQGCASSAATLKQGIEKTFRDELPEIGEVIDATDHTAGSNPFY